MPDDDGIAYGLDVGSAEKGIKFRYNFHDDTDGHRLGVEVTTDGSEKQACLRVKTLTAMHA